MTYKTSSPVSPYIAAAVLSIFGLGATDAVAADTLPLTRGASIAITNSKGKFDFLEVDARRDRLLAAHEEDSTADIFDLNTNRLIKRLKVGPAVGTAVDPAKDQYFISVQGDRRVAVVDAGTLAETGSIVVDGETDAIIFDTKDRRVYVTHDNGKEVWVIDADSKKVVATITVPGVPECMAYDPATSRIYLNIKDRDEVAVIDATSNKLIAQWPTSPATKPHGIAFDGDTGRVFSAGDNGILVVLDAKSGKVTATSKITRKVDQIAFDAGNKRVYSTGPGWVSVVQETADGVTPLGDVKTAPGAMNVAVDPKTHAIWTTFTDGKDAYAKSWLP